MFLYVCDFQLQTAPLSRAVEQLAIKLNVRPSQILLLRKDVDLPVHSSVSELGLGIADIIGNKTSLLIKGFQVHL